jgi:transcriptional regulator with XRE-family HTH domain
VSIVDDQADFEVFEDDPNEFGFWVREQRERKKWSQLHLASESGVSQPQISNIEAGRSSNPRTQTKERISKALGVKLPSAISVELAADAKIPGIGDLLDFDPYDSTDVPQEGGVYVLYDLTNRPVYVGEGGSIAARIKDHEEKFWFKRPVVQAASYIRIEEQKLRRQVEKVLIKFLKTNALLNKQNVDRK